MTQALKLYTYPTPPFFYLLVASLHCQKAVTTYIKLWKDKNKDNLVYIAKDDILDQYSIKPSKFRHDLFLLFEQGLLSIDETPTKYVIEMTDWEDVLDECC